MNKLLTVTLKQVIQRHSFPFMFQNKFMFHFSNIISSSIVVFKKKVCTYVFFYFNYGFCKKIAVVLFIVLFVILLIFLSSLKKRRCVAELNEQFKCFPDSMFNMKIGRKSEEIGFIDVDSFKKWCLSVKEKLEYFYLHIDRENLSDSCSYFRCKSFEKSMLEECEKLRQEIEYKKDFTISSINSMLSHLKLNLDTTMLYLNSIIIGSNCLKDQYNCHHCKASYRILSRSVKIMLSMIENFLKKEDFYFERIKNNMSKLFIKSDEKCL